MEKINNTAPPQGCFYSCGPCHFPHQFLYYHRPKKKLFPLKSFFMLVTCFRGDKAMSSRIQRDHSGHRLLRPWLFLSRGGNLPTKSTRSCLNWLQVHSFCRKLIPTHPRPDIKMKNKNESCVSCYLKSLGFLFISNMKAQFLFKFLDKRTREKHLMYFNSLIFSPAFKIEGTKYIFVDKRTNEWAHFSIWWCKDQKPETRVNSCELWWCGKRWQ